MLLVKLSQEAVLRVEVHLDTSRQPIAAVGLAGRIPMPAEDIL